MALRANLLSKLDAALGYLHNAVLPLFLIQGLSWNLLSVQKLSVVFFWIEKLSVERFLKVSAKGVEPLLYAYLFLVFRFTFRIVYTVTYL